MYATIYSALRPYWRGGQEIRRHRQEVEQTQWYSRQDLEEWQLARLRSVVRYAYDTVPFHRRRLTELGIHPQDIRSLKDFQLLPFMTREDVNDYLQEMVSSEWRGWAEANSTGGSTGQPMQFFMEQSYHWWDWALEQRGRGWYGVRDGDKTAWVWGAHRDMPDWTRGARLKAFITRNRYLNAFSMTEAKTAEFAAELARWHPVMIRAYASALSLLAEYVRHHDIRGIRPRLVETTAEKLTAPQRELFEDTFQCPVADWYSAREFGTIGFQCPAGSLHVCETRYLEVLANGRVVPPGQLGEVAITSLHQHAMPFIRYMLGDSAISQPEPCSCGRGLPVLGEIAGRVHEFLVDADGQLLDGLYFPHTLRNYPEISRYQVYQPAKGLLELRLELKREVNSTWLEDIRGALQAHFGAATRVSIETVDRIELTPAGKLRPIISEVRPTAAGHERAVPRPA